MPRSRAGEGTPREEARRAGPAPPQPDRAPAEEPVTAREEAAEPAGEEEAANEARREAETERPAAVEEAAEDSPAEQEDPLVLARRERDEYLELARRTQATFENYRKRAAKEAAQAGERAKSGLVRELLPVVDNLERAIASAGDGDEGLADGVRMVHSELIAVLQRNGVEQFDPTGESFDPAVQEALSTRSEDGAEPGTVLEVIEKGYRLNEQVLRPARVVVSG